MAETDLLTLETRLAQLETQMAEWKAQQPTTYYTHQYSGEEIDAATGRALTGGALDTSVTNVSNQLGTFARPNLLDNWYFGRAVNQRGQTEYTGNVYGVDRWLCAEPSTVTEITDGGIHVSCTQTGWHVIQKLKNVLYKGNTYTFSAIYKSTLPLRLVVNWGDNKYFFNESSPATSEWALVTITGTVPNDAEITYEQVIFQLLGAGAGTLDIKAAKLELGPHQTLAHQDAAGKWVLNEVPEYGEQLRRCQRYAIDGKYYTTVGKLNYDGNVYYISVQFPFAMRTLPAITLKEISAIGWGTLPISSAELSWVDANGFFVTIKDLSNMDNFIGRRLRNRSQRRIVR